MRRSIIAISAVAAIAAGGALAVPALADDSPAKTASTSSTASGLTDTQQKELDQFLSTHPKLAQHLGARLDRWAAFAKAHPAVVAELQKVARMAPEQRRTELKAWAKAHPADAKAWHEFRQEVRQARKDRREHRRDGTSKAPSSSSPSASSNTSSTA